MEQETVHVLLHMLYSNLYWLGCLGQVLHYSIWSCFLSVEWSSILMAGLLMMIKALALIVNVNKIYCHRKSASNYEDSVLCAQKYCSLRVCVSLVQVI